MLAAILLSILLPAAVSGNGSLGVALHGGVAALSDEVGKSEETASHEPADIALLRAAALIRTGRSVEALALLDGVKEKTDASDWLAQAACVLRTRSLLEAGRFEEAVVASAVKPKRRHSVLRVLQRWYGARSLSALGRFQEAERSFRRLSADPVGKALDPELSLAALGNAATGRLEKAAVHWLSQVGASNALEESRRIAARIPALKLLGKSVDGQCGKLFSRYPCAPLPPECGAMLPESLSSSERFERAERLFDCWGYKEAAAEFEAFLASPAYRNRHDRSHFFLAEIHARKLRDDRESALAHYEHVWKHGGGSRSYALYQMGRCLMNLERYDEATAIFEQYVAKYPHGEFAEQCYYYFGWLPYDHDRIEDALPGFDRYLEKYRKGKQRTYIIWFKAWSLYRLGRLAEALPELVRLSAYGNDIVAGKALYWIGRIHEKTGKPESATAAYGKVLDRYPLSYYGASSWLRLRAMGDKREYPLFEAPVAAVPVPSPTDWERHWPKERLDGLLPVLDAVLAGEVGLARRLFAPLEGEFERGRGEAGALSYHWIHSLLEQPDRVRAWGQSHHRHRGGRPGRKSHTGWMLEFPRAYQLLVELEGRTQSLPPWFLYSIMRQESRYRRGVVSWADAVGLLQIIPQTAARTAQMLSIPFVRADMAKPEVNIRLGVGYLGGLARDFTRQLILVAASYNAGPNAIRTFLAVNRDRDLDFMIEEIAYNEARNYCRKVTGHVLKYLAVYADDATRREVFDLLFPARLDFAPGSSVPF